MARDTGGRRVDAWGAEAYWADGRRVDERLGSSGGAGKWLDGWMDIGLDQQMGGNAGSGGSKWTGGRRGGRWEGTGS